MKSSFDRFWDNIESHYKSIQIDAPFEIGEVISEVPLIIRLGELSLNSDNLYINPYLLAWDEKVNITTSTVEDHNHTISIIHHDSKLKVGNSIVCYGIEYNEQGKTYQRYCLLEVIE
ncbi:DUF2577 family protein [uncultured Clostridium sp.]|uniref:DUF2577 family protein n=1 Tax=uncultured Clostridium sp. TaxID=59620 RepID=UPI0028EB3D9D|nr:DUF2577 family protein [uncultured Clostridium sp.]